MHTHTFIHIYILYTIRHSVHILFVDVCMPRSHVLLLHCAKQEKETELSMGNPMRHGRSTRQYDYEVYTPHPRHPYGGQTEGKEDRGDAHIRLFHIETGNPSSFSSLPKHTHTTTSGVRNTYNARAACGYCSVRHPWLRVQINYPAHPSSPVRCVIRVSSQSLRCWVTLSSNLSEHANHQIEDLI